LSFLTKITAKYNNPGNHSWTRSCLTVETGKRDPWKNGPAAQVDFVGSGYNSRDERQATYKEKVVKMIEFEVQLLPE
jgi:hypothetical protein